MRDTPNGARLWWNWELDSAQYANWGEMVSRLQGRGVRTLTYINPFLVNASDKPGHRRNLLQEASDRGYLVQKLVNSSSGATEDYILPSGDFNFGTVDLSSRRGGLVPRCYCRQHASTCVFLSAAGCRDGCTTLVNTFLSTRTRQWRGSVTFHNLFTERWSELRPGGNLRRHGAGVEWPFSIAATVGISRANAQDLSRVSKSWTRWTTLSFRALGWTRSLRMPRFLDGRSAYVMGQHGRSPYCSLGTLSASLSTHALTLRYRWIHGGGSSGVEALSSVRHVLA